MRKLNDRLVPLLVEVQQNLDQDLDLASLAARFGLSEFHFHRTFARAVGETPKKHVERLRLERAAFLIAVTDEPIVDIALACGFKNPETLSRNFRTFLGHSPSGYRRIARLAQADRVANTNFHARTDFALSRARFATLQPQRWLARHHIGDYEQLHERFGTRDHPWNDLRKWASERGVGVGDECIGIYYDDPTVTPKPLHRADLCLPLLGKVSETEAFRTYQFPGGLYAIAEYVGTAEGVLDACRGTADEIRRSEIYTFRTAPLLEIVCETNVNGAARVHRTKICFAVQKKARDSKNRQASKAGRA
jgi:AraC-like DNA-binding protein/DNA gyrase inhibitor GyrI